MGNKKLLNYYKVKLTLMLQRLKNIFLSFLVKELAQ